MLELTVHHFDARKAGAKVIQVHVPPLLGKTIEHGSHSCRREVIICEIDDEGEGIS